MFKRILVTTDGSSLSEFVAERAVQLAHEHGATLTAVTVSVPSSGPAAQASLGRDALPPPSAREPQRYMEAIRKNAEKAGVEFNSVHVTGDQAHAAIIEVANTHGSDLICMGSRGRGGLNALLSVTMKVLTQSKIPVLVWR